MNQRKLLFYSRFPTTRYNHSECLSCFNNHMFTQSIKFHHATQPKPRRWSPDVFFLFLFQTIIFTWFSSYCLSTSVFKWMRRTLKTSRVYFVRFSIFLIPLPVNYIYIWIHVSICDVRTDRIELKKKENYFWVKSLQRRKMHVI